MNISDLEFSEFMIVLRQLISRILKERTVLRDKVPLSCKLTGKVQLELKFNTVPSQEKVTIELTFGDR